LNRNERDTPIQLILEREGVAPVALLPEGATLAPVIDTKVRVLDVEQE
jgi:hypothetical protein